MDFSIINKTTKHSYNEQKQLIKRVFQGKKVTCNICHQILTLKLASPECTSPYSNIFCQKGCTDLALEISKFSQV